MPRRNDAGNFGSKEMRNLIRALLARNEGCEIRISGNNHAIVTAPGKPRVMMSSGKGDPYSVRNAMRDLRKAGYNL